MPELNVLYEWTRHLPINGMELAAMQRAFLGLLLLSPMTSIMGVQVVNFRMAFFADAISHSAFAGVAIGLLFSLNPHWTTPVFALILGLAIMFSQRRTTLSSDTLIGVFFSAVIAFGIAVVSRNPSVTGDMRLFLYGDILTTLEVDLTALILLNLALLFFQTLGFNKLMYLGLSTSLASAHRVPVALLQYVYAALLSLVVIFSVSAVGVLMVTALLIVPAAAARTFARSARGMVWWAQLIGISSSIAGLWISAQPWAGTATGATIVLVCFAWFLASMVWNICFACRRSGGVR